MRLRFHSSLVLMAMMTLPFEGECVQLSLGSIGHHKHTNELVQVYNDDCDGVPDYAALA